MKKKTLAVIICIIVMIAGAAATIAYFTDNDGAENIFTVGKVEITLEETGTTDFGDAKQKNYQMIPGTMLDKDPTVTVLADSKGCWLFVTVEESNIKGFDEAGEAVTYSFSDFIRYSVITTAGEWTALDGYNGVYYRLVADTDADQEFSIINDGAPSNPAVNKVVVKDTITKEMMEALKKSGAVIPELTFKAYAIQDHGFETAESAWLELTK